MRFDNVPLLIAGVAAVAFAFVLYFGSQGSAERDAWAARCFAAGGTPIATEWTVKPVAPSRHVCAKIEVLPVK